MAITMATTTSTTTAPCIQIQAGGTAGSYDTSIMPKSYPLSSY